MVSRVIFLGWGGAFPVVQDGSYSLFETDSEEEEAAEGSDVETQDQRPKPKTAFQVLLLSWGWCWGLFWVRGSTLLSPPHAGTFLRVSPGGHPHG